MTKSILSLLGLGENNMKLEEDAVLVHFVLIKLCLCVTFIRYNSIHTYYIG